jgi:hypothetical protein
MKAKQRNGNVELSRATKQRVSLVCTVRNITQKQAAEEAFELWLRKHSGKALAGIRTAGG